MNSVDGLLLRLTVTSPSYLSFILGTPGLIL
jgi:hypothetical protein